MDATGGKHRAVVVIYSLTRHRAEKAAMDLKTFLGARPKMVRIDK
jgi:hypothetical protein